MDVAWGAVIAVTVLVLAAAVGVGLLLWRVNARQRSQRGADLAELEQTAGQALVRADELIRLAEDEAGFAAAEFGPGAAENLLTAVQHARARTRHAFHLRQLLADSEPDTPEQREQWNRQIIELCATAEKGVRAETSALAGRRSAAREVPDAIATIRTQVAETRAGLEPARATLDRLAGRYAESALVGVAPNPEQAEAMLAFAERSLEIAGDRLDTRRPEDADKAIRAASEAVGRATALLAAVEGFELQALEADGKLAAVVTDSASDIAEARQLPARQATEVAAAVERLEAALATAPQPGARSDPFAALSTLTEANGALETAMRQLQGRAERAAHVTRQLAATKDEAARQIDHARRLFAQYGGMVGPDARTSLAEAMRELGDAEVEPDPEQALRRARRAADLAVRASSLAQADARASAREEARYSSGPYGPDQGGYGPRIGGSRSSGVVGGILGGIVLGEILDGFDGVEDFFD
ncbi:conserved hypothetical protein [Beutenbergia cavernae DSM 12333]|uniref:TPM domain-containing protein n=1 Tax=Beutenbergia cavernae (strain ATCC BAA-8 / DSM 12333 / CCUG 43141 / JCM 11478 / NBRC 16432 / NCIMB 13614 / HKI 0122) TaxID=471853 RepID=C5C2J9_BEUC1|nr:hypothetical protein [Beutenbergia cavernae]ACQ79685.1 conserved hypothetical protein [Beutenbergia cavernae DSM 12333]